MTTDAEPFRRCSTCKKPIDFEAAYYECSVSTCNRKRTGLYFCSLGCWEAHLPMMRHRDAWAVEARAPTREAHAAEEPDEPARVEAARPAISEPARASSAEHGAEARWRVVASPPDAAEEDVLVVVSKLKAYVRARSGMNTSDAVAHRLSNHLRRLCDAAIQSAERDGRRTLLERDFDRR